MKHAIFVFALVLVSLGGFFGVARAEKVLLLRSTIDPGVLSADIRDEFGDSIESPFLNLKAEQSDCEEGGNLASGTFEGRIYIENPQGTSDGWTLTLAEVDNGKTKDISNQYSCDNNDKTVLSVDPTSAKLQTDCLTCTTKNILLGTNSVDDTQSITLLRANGHSDSIGRWYITGIDVSRATSEPASNGSDLILTATAS